MHPVAILACASLVWLLFVQTGVVKRPAPGSSETGWLIITVAASVLLSLWIFHAQLHLWIGPS